MATISCQVAQQFLRISKHPNYSNESLVTAEEIDPRRVLDSGELLDRENTGGGARRKVRLEIIKERSTVKRRQSPPSVHLCDSDPEFQPIDCRSNHRNFNLFVAYIRNEGKSTDMGAIEYVTGEDNYECSLSQETQQIAKDELREDKNTRDQALEQIRNWIKMNPRIENSRLDAQFVLRFLRCKKFNVPMAEEAIERYLLLRQVYHPAFNHLDATEQTMEELLSLGYLFATPGRDAKGRRVVIARPGVFDPHKYTNADMCRIHAITYETLMEDEENQVRGFVHFADGAGVSFPHLTLFTPKEAVRIVKNGERTIPMRHKEVHAINTHPSVKFALDFGLTLISDKIRKRVKIYTSLEEAVNQKMDTSLLPKEYGGTMPMKEMIVLWRKELLDMRPTLLSHDKMKVRLELYSEKAREGAVSALKQGFGCMDISSSDSTMYGITGSFRKLEVD